MYHLVGSSLIFMAIICASLCHYQFFQLNILRNYDLLLNCLNFRTLSSIRCLYALFLINALRAK
jgi:hypothetical protein